MKVIHKKISLEQFKSRMPSIIPAYDEKGIKHDFLYLNDLQSENIVNYGMIPYNIYVDKLTDNGINKYENTIYSYHQLVRLFHSFDAHYNELMTDKCDKRDILPLDDQQFYDWLLVHCFPYFYFEKELSDKVEELTSDGITIFALLKYWNTNRLSLPEVKLWRGRMMHLKTECTDNYSHLQQKVCCNCQEYKNRGGDILLNALNEWYNNITTKSVCDYTDYNNEFKYNVKETDKYITIKTLKQVKNNYVVVNHTFTINKPRIKILGNNRYIDYGIINEDGIIENPKQIDIINGEIIIPSFDFGETNLLVIDEPYFSIPLQLTNSMENLGTMSPLSEDWDGGYEYNSAGVIVNYNDENWVLKSSEYPGYLYSNKFQEIYFANIDGMTDTEYSDFLENEEDDLKENCNEKYQWEKYIDTIPTIDLMQPKTYSYKNNTLIINPTPYLMGDEYEIYTNENNGYYLLNDKLYPLFDFDYVDVNDKKYQVFYLSEVNPYIIINNKITYINKKCKSLNYEIKQGNGYKFNEYVELVVGGKGKKVDGYNIINGSYVYYKLDENEVMKETYTYHLGEYSETLQKQIEPYVQYTTYKKDNGIFYTKISIPYVEYSNETISGETTSKLNNFINEKYIVIDNLGNRIDALLPYSTSYNYYPKFNDWLGIPYTPKYVINSQYIKDNLYYGDIIDNIIFSYSVEKNIEVTDDLNEHFKEHQVSGNSTVNTTFEFNELDTDESGTLIQCIITHVCNQMVDVKYVENILQKESTNIHDITCKVIYYMGSVLQNDDDNTFSLYTNNSTTFSGIKYIDEFTLEHNQCLYYHNELDACILNYWKMTPRTSTYKNQTYNVDNITEPVSYFEYNVKPFELTYGFIDNFNNKTTFYKVEETSQYVEIDINNKTKKCEIYLNGNKKLFSYILPKNAKMFQDYSYYYIINDKKYYAKYINNGAKEYFEIDTGVSKLTSNGMENAFYLEEIPGIQLAIDIYCEKEIKFYILTTQFENEKSLNSYFDFTNDMSLCPLIMKENYLGFSDLEKIQSDIYIDRGTTRVIDFHLRLMEAKSLESLEQIGNGFFSINNNL